MLYHKSSLMGHITLFSGQVLPLSLNSPNLPSICKAPCPHLSFSHPGNLNFSFTVFRHWKKKTFLVNRYQGAGAGCMFGLCQVARCPSWWGSWGGWAWYPSWWGCWWCSGRAPLAPGEGSPGKNLSGTAAAASSAPPPLLFKLHLNPSDFLGWTRQGRIHTYLERHQL